MSVLVAMSGGVDSSVAAFLMSEKYKNSCHGATMILFNACSNENNINDAKAICERLKIPHSVINYEAEFKKRVIENFIETYERGGTPNPCIECNKYLKFGALFDHAKNSGLNKIATGHYAIIERSSSGRYLLKKAHDTARDQSYVLYVLSQKILSCVEFPLGGMTKSEVRNLAAQLNFINSNRTDSQDICFVPDGNYAGFIKNQTGKNYSPGNFIDTSGKILGVHKGIINYTAGQRRGLGVSAPTRLFILKIDPESNNITLAPENDDELYFKSVKLKNINLIALDKIENFLNARVKIRYRQNEIPAKIFQTDENNLAVEFQQPQLTPAIGQSCVIYDGDYVIGGGIIAEACK